MEGIKFNTNRRYQNVRYNSFKFIQRVIFWHFCPKFTICIITIIYFFDPKQPLPKESSFATWSIVLGNLTNVVANKMEDLISCRDEVKRNFIVFFVFQMGSLTVWWSECDILSSKVTKLSCLYKERSYRQRRPEKRTTPKKKQLKRSKPFVRNKANGWRNVKHPSLR